MTKTGAASSQLVPVLCSVKVICNFRLHVSKSTAVAGFLTVGCLFTSHLQEHRVLRSHSRRLDHSKPAARACALRSLHHSQGACLATGLCLASVVAFYPSGRVEGRVMWWLGHVLLHSVLRMSP